tara:strand:+ start:108 stop:347 length:240 start_codon:yes stop_codon:yes gene_type:complete
MVENKWMKTVKETMRANAGKSLKEVLKIAKKKYRSSKKVEKKPIRKKKTVNKRKGRRSSSHIHTRCVRKAMKKCARHKH